MTNDDYKIRILDLAQRWRVDLLTQLERLELETWFRSLEDTDLGPPLEISIDSLERRLHQLFTEKTVKPTSDEGPPYPFK
jgi:hypothetical protein